MRSASARLYTSNADLAPIAVFPLPNQIRQAGFRSCNSVPGPSGYRPLVGSKSKSPEKPDQLTSRIAGKLAPLDVSQSSASAGM